MRNHLETSCPAFGLGTRFVLNSLNSQNGDDFVEWEVKGDVKGMDIYKLTCAMIC